MVKKNLSIAARQDELILEQQLGEEETPAEIEAIRAALIKGKQSGFSDRSVDEIWEESRQRRRSVKTSTPTP